MRLAHLSDLHLGYRAFGHHEQGRNVREMDVAKAFHQAISKVIEIAPSASPLKGSSY